MDTLALNVFVQAAETRSFVAAGRILGISASGIGKSVGRLEESLGVRLFHRSTRSVTLTAEGEMFLERARRILAEFDAAQAELSQASTVPKGRLRIGFPLVGDPFLPALAEFQRRYPEIELDVEFDNRKVDVIEEGFDAVVRSGEIEDSRLKSRLLGHLRMLLVGAPDYFARHAPERAFLARLHSVPYARHRQIAKLALAARTQRPRSAIRDQADVQFQRSTPVLRTRRLGHRLHVGILGPRRP
jgi:DNA-binding transcriptional LysR family regulator